jgi:hypothetical protein
VIRRLFLATLLLVSAASASANVYNDVFYDVAEPGWGLFVKQSNTFQFLAFFIYGPDGQPTWYTAQLTDDGTGNYTGGLYAHTGTFFPLPWNPADREPQPSPQVGTASFQPIDIYHATLTYTVNGVGTATKAIVRQTLTGYQMAGNYSGSMAGSITGCADPTKDIPVFRGRYNLAVTQVGDASATLVFTFVDATYSGIVCTASGALNHLGRLYQAVGTLACTGPAQDGVARPGTIDSLHPTGQGIEGRITGAGGGGCMSSLHFAAVNVN